MARAPRTRSEVLVVTAGSVGLVVLLYGSFLASGEDTWGWASAPLFVYGALGGVAIPVAGVLAHWTGWRTTPLFGLTWGQVHLGAGTLATVSGLCLVLTRVGSALAAWIGLLAGLGVLTGALDQLRTEGRPLRASTLSAWVVRSPHDRPEP